jgi:hypothetical protein
MQPGAKLVATLDVGTVLDWKGAADGAPAGFSLLFSFLPCLLPSFLFFLGVSLQR